MNKVLKIAVLACLPALSFAEVESVFTDAEAAEKARVFLKDALEMRAPVGKLCAAKDEPKLYAISNKLIDRLKEWPDDHLKYRALFPYSDCKQVMMDLQAYAAICALGKYRGEAASYDQRRWKEDTTACAAAIKNPDLSLKDIE
ncbi:hypothetical protein ABS648_05305 [Pseudomonas solani]|uniref:DUF1311 domain-containing protein n=1 Tax=Pseudomonas solani TaxID=2731552 RepID=A0AAU7Y622_9PSED